jgi:hypothetical protein
MMSAAWMGQRWVNALSSVGLVHKTGGTFRKVGVTWIRNTSEWIQYLAVIAH